MAAHKSISGTEFSIGEWKSVSVSPVGNLNASTKAQQSSSVMVRGSIVNDKNGQPKLMVSVDPKVVERNVAIEQLKKQLHGFPDIETETMLGRSYRSAY